MTMQKTINDIHFETWDLILCLWLFFYLFFCIYFVASNDKADIRTKHLLQFLHPALHLFQTVVDYCQNLWHWKNIHQRHRITHADHFHKYYKWDQPCGNCPRLLCHRQGLLLHQDHLKTNIKSIFTVWVPVVDRTEGMKSFLTRRVPYW